MRVLVTGVTSDSGARLGRRLASQGHEVVCVVRRPGSAPAGTTEVVAPLPRLDAPWEADARAAFSRAALGCELAFLVTPIGLALQPWQVLQSAGARRVVCVSSTRRHTRWPDAAARSVIAVEEALVRAGRGFVALRSTMIYGGERDKNMRRWLRWLERLPVMPLPGGGRSLIQPIFIDDLVAALLRAADAPEAEGQIVDVGGPRAVSMRDAAETMARVRGLRRWFVPIPLAPARWAARLLRPGLEPVVRRMGEDRVADLSTARRLLGFAPRELEAGLRSMLESDRETRRER